MGGRGVMNGVKNWEAVARDWRESDKEARVGDYGE